MLHLLSRVIRELKEERMIATLVSKVKFNILNDVRIAGVWRLIRLLIGLLLQVRLIVQIALILPIFCYKFSFIVILYI
jgi:hypothetical protein